MNAIWKDGVMLLLRMSVMASERGEKEVALSLLQTAIIAQGKEYQ